VESMCVPTMGAPWTRGKLFDGLTAGKKDQGRYLNNVQKREIATTNKINLL